MKITFDHQTLAFFLHEKTQRQEIYIDSLTCIFKFYFIFHHVCAGLNINQDEHNLREAKTSFQPVLTVEQAACLVQLMVPFYNESGWLCNVVWRLEYFIHSQLPFPQGFLGGSVINNLPANVGDVGSIPGSGRSPGGGNVNPLQYSCLGNPTEEEPGELQYTGLKKSQTWFSN